MTTRTVRRASFTFVLVLAIALISCTEHSIRCCCEAWGATTSQIRFLTGSYSSACCQVDLSRKFTTSIESKDSKSESLISAMKGSSNITPGSAFFVKHIMHASMRHSGFPRKIFDSQSRFPSSTKQSYLLLDLHRQKL